MDTRKLIDYSAQDDGATFRQDLYANIYDKVNAHIDAKKKEVAANMFTPENAAVDPTEIDPHTAPETEMAEEGFIPDEGDYLMLDEAVKHETKSVKGGHEYQLHKHSVGTEHEWHSIVKTKQSGTSTKNEFGGYPPMHVGTPTYIAKHWKKLGT